MTSHLARVSAKSCAVLAAAGAAALSFMAFAVPSASAAPTRTQSVGWIQLAHLSPNTPAVDVYLYSFGDSSAQLVLDHVSYGTVSPFEQVAAGDYTVAMRAAGAPASSKPVLSTVVDITAGHAYTVAGMGPASGLRLQVIQDALTTPAGKALVRIIQASMQEDTVNVSAGTTHLATGLRFASVTSYVAVKPGTWTVTAAGSTESTTSTITLAAGSIHTLVVLDDPGKLVIDDLLEAAASETAPIGAVQTGFGGTAGRAGASLQPWLAAGGAGTLAAAAGTVLLMRRRRPALHARQPVRSA
jgi:hypothetical protein